MDEIWQRHKAFILEVVVGGLVFVIALIVMWQSYGDGADPVHLRARNRADLDALQRMLAEGKAPSPVSIQRQKNIQRESEQQIAKLAGEHASVVEGDAYVRENLEWTLKNIGRAQELNRFLNLYRQIPQACLSSVLAEARNALVGRAAQLGKEVDESLGLAAGFQDDEIPAALHGLAIVSDVVGRCLDRPGIQSVTELRVTPRDRFAGELGFVTSFPVHVSITGDPADVVEVLRGFNATDLNPVHRRVVLESVEYVTRLPTEADTVKASVVVAGLQHKGVK